MCLRKVKGQTYTNMLYQAKQKLPPGIDLVKADDFREWLVDIRVLDTNPLYMNQIYRLSFLFSDSYPIGMNSQAYKERDKRRLPNGYRWLTTRNSQKHLKSYSSNSPPHPPTLRPPPNHHHPHHSPAAPSPSTHTSTPTG